MAHKARPNSILHIRDMSKAQFRMAKIKRVYKAVTSKRKQSRIQAKRLNHEKNTLILKPQLTTKL